MLAESFTCQTTRQDAIQFAFVSFGEQHHIQRVVRNLTTVGAEVIQAFRQRGLQFGIVIADQFLQQNNIIFKRI